MLILTLEKVANMAQSLPEGTQLRHRTGCPMLDGGARCRCRPAYRLRLRLGDGRRVSATFDTLAEATAWRAEQLGPNPPRPDRARRQQPTIRALAYELLDGIEAGTILNRNGTPWKPSVAHAYRVDIEGTVVPVFGDDLVGQVTPRDVQDLVDRLSASGLSPSTVRNRLKPLRVIYRRAVFDQLVQVSPVDAVQLPADRGRREQHVPAHVIAPMLEALDDVQLRAAWSLLLLAGLRVGEALGLRWADVDHTLGCLHVRQSWCNRSHQMTEPKTRGSSRAVPRPAALRRALAALADARGPEPSHAVILHAAGQLDVPMSRNVIARHAVEAWQAAGLPIITPHAARHSWATMAVEAGMPLHDVARHLGHTSLQMVMQRYAHLQPGTLERSAGIIDRAAGVDAPLPVNLDQLEAALR